MLSPTEVDGYMIVARDLLAGVDVLAKASPAVPSRCCALIAAHALECALKAFLSTKGKTREITRHPAQHNLILLWEMAHEEQGLSISQIPPDWVTTLGVGHGPNYYFRYQRGENKTIVHGGGTPALIPMAVELRAIIDKVALVVGV